MNIPFADWTVDLDPGVFVLWVLHYDRIVLDVDRKTTGMICAGRCGLGLHIATYRFSWSVVLVVVFRRNDDITLLCCLRRVIGCILLGLSLALTGFREGTVFLHRSRNWRWCGDSLYATVVWCSLGMSVES